MITTDPDTGPVNRSDLVKGYEVEKGQYILITDDEIKSVKLESTKTIDIERFVPADEIDRIYWDHPYFLAPDGITCPRSVCRHPCEAMKKSGQIALGRVVLSTRERILALEPARQRHPRLFAATDDEVRKATEIFGSISDAKPDAG